MKFLGKLWKRLKRKFTKKVHWTIKDNKYPCEECGEVRWRYLPDGLAQECVSCGAVRRGIRGQYSKVPPVGKGKCIGSYDRKLDRVVKCGKPVDGERSFCKKCGDKMMTNFTGAWADIAQAEAPDARREHIESEIERILGLPPKESE